MHFGISIWQQIPSYSFSGQGCNCFAFNPILARGWDENFFYFKCLPGQQITFEPGYNEHCVCDTSCAASNILWYQLIPHNALHNTTYIKASASDITTLTAIGSFIIFQEVDYFKNSTILSSLREQNTGLWIRGLGNDNRNAIHIWVGRCLFFYRSR